MLNKEERILKSPKTTQKEDSTIGIPPQDDDGYVMVAVGSDASGVGAYQTYDEAMLAIEGCPHPVWKQVGSKKEGKEYVFNYCEGTG